jgi:hypothetical protein
VSEPENIGGTGQIPPLPTRSASFEVRIRQTAHSLYDSSMKALFPLALALFTFALPAAAEDGCARPTPVTADGTNCVVTVGPIFKRPEAERRHEVAPAP